ncbi:class III extradiol dioxygenase subunit B-like domain-containing protein [Amycolatopsis alkalitolerans]|uniref:Catalytic LigB subunit of aromatic ring-opening dioxygenase n=1 Tax=Amycolatopsis alkalitolerans TaxID=2547244 RepID=A0A5C4M7H2_9PSEU|nr:class III extradiol dioxygenase subunit B-like domain-containing protein [Amycolatopsis alkalitolerans]TNC28925.1 hypothetical protein FG385_02070 [Amycolatopsis alkalitolerans]
MIRRAVVVPQPPLLVPRLSPGPAPDLATLREACVAAAGTLGPVWTAVGVHTRDEVIGPDAAGSFRGYGVDERVRLSAHGTDRDLPLPALIAGWLREQAGAESVQVRLVAEGTRAADCARLGHELDGDLLILGDGSNRHGPGSPGSEDERAPAFDELVAKALAKADTEALLRLDPALARDLGAGGRVPWQVLAGTGGDWHAELLYSAAPFGVAYHVAVWERG